MIARLPEMHRQFRELAARSMCSRPRCRCKQRPIGHLPVLPTPKPTGRSILRPTRQVSEAMRRERWLINDRPEDRCPGDPTRPGSLVDPSDGSERRDSVTLEAVDRPRGRRHESLCVEIRGVRTCDPIGRIQPPRWSDWWQAAAASRYSSPRQLQRQGLGVACVGIKYEFPEELRDSVHQLRGRGNRQARQDDQDASPSGSQARRHGRQGHQERDLHALAVCSALSGLADFAMVVSPFSRRQPGRFALALGDPRIRA